MHRQIFLVVALCVISVGASPLRTHHELSPEYANCLDFLGDCRFYRCIAQARGCPGFIVQPFERIVCHAHDTLTDTAQLWLTKTLTCHSSKLLRYAATSSGSSCIDLEIWSRNQMPKCASKHGVCDLLRSERDTLSTVCKNGHWIDLVELAHKCPRKDIDDFIHWIMF